MPTTHQALSEPTHLSETALLLRLKDIHEALISVKPLYAEQDSLVMELIARGLQSSPMPDGSTAQIIDNFIDPKTNQPRNTAFRPAGVKRFEIHFLTPDQLLKSQKKASAK